MSNYNKLIAVSTLQDAQVWASQSEKTLWCLDFLQECSVNHPGFEQAQDRLEARFEILLKWRQVRDVLTPLANLLGELNAADADGVNSLPAHWASSRSVYGAVQQALYLAVEDHFGYRLADVCEEGPNWGGNGDHWSRDLLEWVLDRATA
jgi:hypothetical protein